MAPEFAGLRKDDLIAKVFISQAAIDGWVSTEKADLQGADLVLRDSNVVLRLTPASLFRSVAGGGDDPNRLVGKVKDEAAVAAMGAEAYMTSVLLGEVAYDVEPGFVAVPVAPAVDDGRWLAGLRAVNS